MKRLRILPTSFLIAGALLAGIAEAQPVTVGDGRTSFGQFNGPDQTPFQQAIDALPRGGCLEVLAGAWTFERPVEVASKGITIRGSGGSMIRSIAAGAVAMFRVTADGFRLTGMQAVVHQAAAQQSAILVTGGSLTVDHCTFTVKAGAPDYRVLEIGDGVQRRGTLIEANQFLFTEASGEVIAITLREGLDLRMANNEFRKVEGIPTGRCRLAVELITESKGTITGNSFQNLGAGAQPMEAVIHSTAETEGHHFAISGNFFENCLAPTVVHLAGGRFCAVTGNVFGRMLKATDGVVRLGATAAGAGGNSNAITGNQFHNVECGVHVSDQLWTTIESNQFTICPDVQVRIAASVQGAMVFGNQFVGSQVLTSDIPFAIQLSGGSDHLIRHNAALSQHPNFGFTQVVSSVPAIDASIEDNWKS